ncbi:hypothetical protein BGX38DRAFT_1170826 [Terfezia claveryi]|nr:hypothetical protein BGX38DRAFT_1170826 [Terfezia claveryi]
MQLLCVTFFFVTTVHLHGHHINPADVDNLLSSHTTPDSSSSSSFHRDTRHGLGQPRLPGEGFLTLILLIKYSMEFANVHLAGYSDSWLAIDNYISLSRIQRDR